MNKYGGFVEASPRQLIYEQIQRCAIAFSDFDASATTVNSIAEIYDTEVMRQKGKKIANSVQTLESLLAPYFNSEFLDNEDTKWLRARAFLSNSDFERLTKPKKSSLFVENEARCLVMPMGNFKPATRRTGGFAYMDSVPEFQQEGVQNIQDYFRHLVSFAFALPMFAEVKTVGDDELWDESSDEEDD